MFKRILTTIDSGRVFTMESLAGEIGVDVGTLSEMMLTLVEKGYLKSSGCDSVKLAGCAKCGIKSMCSGKSLGNAYCITEKGKRFIGK